MKQAIPEHYKLIQEHPASYEIHDGRDGRSFHIAKQGLNLAMHTKLGAIQQFSGGGSVDDSKSVMDPPQSMASKAGSGLRDLIGGVASDTAGAVKSVAGPAIQAGADFASGLLPPGPEASSGDPAPAQPSPAAPSAPVQSGPPQPDPFVSQSNSLNSALDSEKSALMSGANAEGASGSQAAKAYGDFSKDIDAMETPDQIMARHQAADQELMKNFMTKDIDPDHFWNSRSTGDKIGAGIGMLLSGLGAGQAGQPNMAMDVINRAIDRDTDAQKNAQGKAYNLWKMNREATKSEIEANLATKNQKLTAVEARIHQFQAQSAGPLAQARLAPALFQIEQEKAANNFRRAILGASRQGGPIQADPSLLLSSIPEKDRPAAAKEIANAQEIKKLKDDFQSSYNDLNGKFMAGKFSPADRESAINAFAGRIGKVSEGRFNLEEAKLQAAAMLPGIEGNETRQNKQTRLNQFFDSMSTSPTFTGATGVDLKKFASTSMAPTHAPGSMIKYRGQVFQIGQDGKSLTPVK